DGPIVVFSNSVLTTWNIWDGFIQELRDIHPEYKILRYLQRGYNKLSPKSTEPMTVDLLATDLAELLDGLHITKVRWMLPATAKSRVGKEISKMIEGNDLDGFRKTTYAITHLELDNEMGKCEVPGLFVVGQADGLLPNIMKEYP